MSDGTKQSSHSAALRSPGENPVLPFDLNAEMEQLRKEAAWQGGEHRAAGRISVQTVAGHIQMHVEGKVLDLPAGHLLALERAIVHDVEALEEGGFLLTIAWPEGALRV